MAAANPQKILGAFYTTDPVARFLVQWAIRKADDIVLDPSCGNGVFLEAANERLFSLGSRRPQIWGVDVDPSALRASHLRPSGARILEKDFFSLSQGHIPPVNAVVGNPPFIRYQTFNGKQRVSALSRASEVGVQLPQLSSSWAPFIVHAATFLQDGGRLGMVAPAELVHAKYAREVLRFLLRKFGRISVRMFRRKMFKELSEDTVLLLCESFGEKCSWFTITAGTSIDDAELDEGNAIPVNISAISRGEHRLSRYLLPRRAIHLYESLALQEGIERLGRAADVGIGYVTGCNDYFHLSGNEAKTWRIPACYLSRAVLSLGNFNGTVLHLSDWKQLLNAGRKTHLLKVPLTKVSDLPKSLQNYLRYGEKCRVPDRFKCRVRENWYSVPHVRVGDALLSYMSGTSPKLVGNTAGLVAPNTLHVVRFSGVWRWKQFVAGWQSSLTRLSCEIEGHPLGGGMLKLEPFEAENVLIPLPSPNDSASLVSQLDGLLRGNDSAAALELADTMILRRRFGLSKSECTTLCDAAKQLETWRMHK